MGLDASKLNLQGVGTLKSNAVMVSGTNPSSVFNFSISVDSRNKNWSSPGITLTDISSIPIGTGLVIVPNPGYHINSSMFLWEDNDSPYIDSITFADTVGANQPANNVGVFITFKPQDITSDVNVTLHNIDTEEVYEGNLHHSININLTSFSENIDVIITPEQGLTANGNSVGGNILPGEGFKTFCDVTLLINDTDTYGFSWIPEIQIHINSDSLQQDYYIKHISYSDSKIEFRIDYAPSENYYNIQNVPDNINIDPYVVIASITPTDNNIIIPSEGATGNVRYETIHTYLEDIRAIETSSGNEANWIDFSHNYDSINYTVEENPYVSDRSATVFLYNQTYQASVQPLGSFSIVQTDSAALILSGPLQTAGSQSWPAPVEVYDGQADGFSINNLKRSSSTIKYTAIINDDLIWPTEVAGIEENFVIFTDHSPAGSLALNPTSNNWLTDNVTYSGLGTNELTIIFNIPENVESSPERSVDITIFHPQDSSLSKNFYIHQERGFSLDLDNITLYLGDESNLTTNSSGDYYNLPLYGENTMYDIQNTSKTFFAGIKLSQDNIDQGIQVSDFIIEITGRTYNDDTITEVVNPDWCSLSYSSNNYNENESNYDNPRLSFHVQENLGDTRYLDINIYHPNYSQGVPLKTIHVEQQQDVEAYFINNSVEIIQSGSVSVNFYCTTILGSGTPAFTPVIALAGVKQFSYPENNTEPIYNNINVNDNPQGNNIPVGVGETINGFSTFGITSVPTIVAGPGGSTSTGNGSITFNFEPTDQAHVFDYNSYRTWVYYIYPPNTVLSGPSVITTNSNGLNSFSDQSSPQPNAILKIHQIPGIQQDLIGLNGVLMTKTPFDIDRARTLEDGTLNPFYLYFNMNFGNFVLNANRLQADGINNFHLLDFPFGIESSSDLLPINIDNTGYNTSFRVDLSDFGNNYQSYQNGYDSKYSFDLASASEVSYNNVTSIIGINNPDNLPVTITTGSIGQVSGLDPDDGYIYKLKFNLNHSGAYYPFVEDVSQSQHNDSYSNDIPTPTVDYYTDGGESENRYTEPFFKYIKIVSPPLPSQIGIHTPTLGGFHGAPQDMLDVEYFYKIQVGETVYPFSFKRSYYDHFVSSEDYAVFLLAGENNMVGMAPDDSVAWPSDVYQYKYSTYNSNPASPTVDTATSPLDHWNESAGTMGLAKKFAIELRNNNMFPNRKILFIPAAATSTGFVNNKWNKGNSHYNHAVSVTNHIMAYYPDATFEGVLWAQGETDYQANDYAEKMFKTIQNLRDDITVASQETPFVYCDLASALGNTYTDVIYNMLGNLFSKVGEADNSGLGVVSAGNYNASALNTLGTQFYSKWYDLQQNSTDSYPEISAWSQANVQYVFGLDNQMLLNTNHGGAMTVSGGNATYNNFGAYSSGSTAEAYRRGFSYVMPSGTSVGNSINTQISGTTNLTIGIAFIWGTNTTYISTLYNLDGSSSSPVRSSGDPKTGWCIKTNSSGDLQYSRYNTDHELITTTIISSSLGNHVKFGLPIFLIAEIKESGTSKFYTKFNDEVSVDSDNIFNSYKITLGNGRAADPISATTNKPKIAYMSHSASVNDLPNASKEKWHDDVKNDILDSRYFIL